MDADGSQDLAEDVVVNITPNDSRRHEGGSQVMITY